MMVNNKNAQLSTTTKRTSLASLKLQNIKRKTTEVNGNLELMNVEQKMFIH